jgi:hypothetical protein
MHDVDDEDWALFFQCSVLEVVSLTQWESLHQVRARAVSMTISVDLLMITSFSFHICKIRGVSLQLRSP